MKIKKVKDEKKLQIFLKKILKNELKLSDDKRRYVRGC